MFWYVFIFFDSFCGASFFKSNNAVCLLGFQPAVAVLSECGAWLSWKELPPLCVKATKRRKERFKCRKNIFGHWKMFMTWSYEDENFNTICFLLKASSRSCGWGSSKKIVAASLQLGIFHLQIIHHKDTDDNTVPSAKGITRDVGVTCLAHRKMRKKR